MRSCGILVMLLLATSCATTRVVHLDTGRATPLVYKPIESGPVRMDDDAFQASVTRLVLDMKLDVELGRSIAMDRRSLLALNGGVVDGLTGARRSPHPSCCASSTGPPGA